MFNYYSLFSGSSGNSHYIETKNSKILIDVGQSGKKIVNALNLIGSSIEKIDAIFITHEHVDHIKSLGTLSKKHDIPIYATEGTWNAMPKQEEKINLNNKYIIKSNDIININDLTINPFEIPHDAAEPVGYNIYNENKKISVATDIGHITNDILNNLQNSVFVLLESNYDPNVLKCSSYPYYLKERINSPKGHLANSECGKTLNYLIQNGLKQAMIGHLSSENNFPELAYQTVIEELDSNQSTIPISIANRNEPSPVVNIDIL